jgi:V8-like Glu-specific endopeptidase
MAIVLPLERPALTIENGSYARPPPPWEHLAEADSRARVEPAIAAVARVDAPEGSTLPYVGTAFVVGPDLLLTALLRNSGFESDTFDAGMAPIVDFGHEALGGESLRAEVEEVVCSVPEWNVELIRVNLSEAIEPLKLSVAPPEELVGRDVALIGYPSRDIRNDQLLMQRIFGGVFDAKRISPGRVRENLGGELGPAGALIHDCTSMGGCNGSPVVDVTSGEVVGVHLGGRYLEANYAAATWELAQDASFASSGVRFAGKLPRAVTRSGITRDPARPEREERPEELPAATPFSSEADHTLPDTRPTLAATRWHDEVDDGWRRVLEPYGPRLDLAPRAVGKVTGSDGGGSWASAFLVGERLAMTASFATEGFAEGVGNGAAMKPGATATIDFSDALDLAAGTATAAVTGVKFIHPYFNVALLELDQMPEGIAPLELASQLPSQLPGRLLVLVSLVATDEDALHGRMFVQPGKALPLGQLSGDVQLPALVHDCAGGGGSAGAPVIDLGTGYVIGIHSHATRETGFAQPSWELARDPYVWASSITFRPDPRPPWLDRWDTPGPKRSRPEEGSEGARPWRWTVDEVPIDWALEEPKALEKILVASISPERALYFAENVGLQLGTVNRNSAGYEFWRELLRAAAVAGLLRRLVQILAEEPQHAGIAPKLRDYL